MSIEYDDERGYPVRTRAPSEGDCLTDAAWLPFPPPMDREDWAWVWLRDARDYKQPVVVELSCNQAYRIAVYFNELHDLPVDWQSAQVQLIPSPV